MEKYDKSDIRYRYNKVDEVYKESGEPEPTGHYAELLKEYCHEMVKILMHK